MFAFLIIMIVALLAIIGACLYIDKRANEQDAKFIQIRANIMAYCQK